MCGRFTLSVTAAEFAAAWFADPPAGFGPRWNIAPGQDVAVVEMRAGQRAARLLRWGLARAGDSRRVINVRAERVWALPNLAAAWRGHRCLVPADGFYEWTRGRPARPFHFRRAQGEPFALAGLVLGRGRDEALVLVTVPADDVVRPVHPRMPLLLVDDVAADWLERFSPDQAARGGVPGGLTGREVDPAVNSIACEGSQLLAPPAQRSWC